MTTMTTMGNPLASLQITSDEADWQAFSANVQAAILLLGLAQGQNAIQETVLARRFVESALALPQDGIGQRPGLWAARMTLIGAIYRQIGEGHAGWLDVLEEVFENVEGSAVASELQAVLWGVLGASSLTPMEERRVLRIVEGSEPDRLPFAGVPEGDLAGTVLEMLDESLQYVLAVAAADEEDDFWSVDDEGE